MIGVRPFVLYTPINVNPNINPLYATNILFPIPKEMIPKTINITHDKALCSNVAKKVNDLGCITNLVSSDVNIPNPINKKYIIKEVKK